MIRKQIHKPQNISADSVFQIIETHFNGRYKTSRESDSQLNIKRLYKYQSNGWETIQKQLSFNDSGYFKINNNSISFRITLGKQLIFWISLLALGFLLTWKVWKASIGMSISIVTIPIIFVWIYGILEINTFIHQEITRIEKHLGE